MKIGIASIVAALVFACSALAHSVDHKAVQQGLLQPVPFSLISQDGEPFTDLDLAGQPTAVFFGFTSCPDVCPMTLSNLSAMLEELGPLAENMRVVMITVDPANDTPEHLRAFLSGFNPRYVGLTGDQDQIDAAANRFFATYSVKDGAISHSASIYLLDGNGQLKDAIFYTESHESALEKLRALFSWP